MHQKPTAVFLVTWILMASVIVLECQDETCRPARAGGTGKEHHIMTFATEEACQAQRARMQRPPLPPVSSPSRAGLSIQQHLTYTCLQKDYTDDTR